MTVDDKRFTTDGKHLEPCCKDMEAEIELDNIVLTNNTTARYSFYCEDKLCFTAPRCPWCGATLEVLR